MTPDRPLVEVRAVEASDEAPLVRLLLAAEDWAVASTGYLPGPGDLQSLMYALPAGAAPGQKRISAIVARSAVVGLIDAVVDWPEVGTVAVGVFLIDPVVQRRGIGAAALEASFERARSEGCLHVRASCPEGWLQGERFLAQAGFTRGAPSRIAVNRVVHPHEEERRSVPWLYDLTR